MNILLCPFLEIRSSIQSFTHVQLFTTPWTAACQALIPMTNSWSLLKHISIELVMQSSHLILCCPLLLPLSIFPNIRVFPKESLLCIRQPKYWSFSFSISPSNDWFPLGLTGLSSLQSKGLSRVFSNNTVEKHQFSLTLTSIHDYWKNYSFDHVDLYWQSNVSAFYTQFVIIIFPRRKHILILWLQSPYAVILEPKKIPA